MQSVRHTKVHLNRNCHHNLSVPRVIYLCLFSTPWEFPQGIPLPRHFCIQLPTAPEAAARALPSCGQSWEEGQAGQCPHLGQPLQSSGTQLSDLCHPKQKHPPPSHTQSLVLNSANSHLGTLKAQHQFQGQKRAEWRTRKGCSGKAKGSAAQSPDPTDERIRAQLLFQPSLSHWHKEHCSSTCWWHPGTAAPAPGVFYIITNTRTG